MLKARKKNRVVRIPDEKKKEYEKLGYTILDENGNKLYEPENKDATIAALRKENQKLRQQIAEKDLMLAKQESPKTDNKPKKSTVKKE